MVFFFILVFFFTVSCTGGEFLHFASSVGQVFRKFPTSQHVGYSAIFTVGSGDPYRVVSTVLSCMPSICRLNATWHYTRRDIPMTGPIEWKLTQYRVTLSLQRTRPRRRSPKPKDRLHLWICIDKREEEKKEEQEKSPQGIRFRRLRARTFAFASLNLHLWTSRYERNTSNASWLVNQHGWRQRRA